MHYKTTRLSVMMFLQLFVSGCTMPIFSLYMKDYLHFSGSQIGLILAMSAIPSLLSPVIGAFIADRLISAERLLTITHLLGSAIMLGLYFQTEFIPVLFFYLLYGMISGPAFALTTTITFHHAPDAVKSFGGIRLWGTLGWAAAAWVFSFLWSNRGAEGATADLHGALQLSAISSIILAVYALTLPVGLQRKKGRIVLIPRDSLAVILKPEILLLSLFCIIITFADRFYMFGGGPYLKSLGFSDRAVMPLLSIGQLPEIIGLSLLGIALKRIGLKKILIIGAAFEIARFAVFSWYGTGIVLFTGIALHGLTYAYFFVPLTIFLDSRSSPQSRAGVHQLFSILTGGIGGFAGNLLAGYSADLTSIPGSGQINFAHFWIIPLILSCAGLAGVVLFIREQSFSQTTIAVSEDT